MLMILVPVGGLAYFVTAPRTLLDVILDPFHTLFYVMFVVSMCAVLSKAWIEISGSTSRGIARELKDYQMVIKVLATGQDINAIVS